MKLHPLLLCGLARVAHDFETHATRLYLPDGHCTDMRGAISYARRIDPDVTCIETFSGPRRDTTYSRVRGNEWRAVHDGRVFSPDDFEPLDENDHEQVKAFLESSAAVGASCLAGRR